MKQVLLFTILIFLALSSVFAHGGEAPNLLLKENVEVSAFDYGDPQLKIFPNPTTHYIQLSNPREVIYFSIYNVVGRKILTFEVKSSNKYDVSQLSNGMYLVQFMDANNKVITTQRLSKR